MPLVAMQVLHVSPFLLWGLVVVIANGLGNSMLGKIGDPGEGLPGRTTAPCDMMWCVTYRMYAPCSVYGPWSHSSPDPPHTRPCHSHRGAACVHACACVCARG